MLNGKLTSQRLRKCCPRLLLYLVMGSMALLMVTPFYYMVITSFKQLSEVNTIPISLGIRQVTLLPYESLVTSLPYFRFMGNSFIIAVSTTVGGVMFGTLAGFAFAKLEFPLRRTLFFLILSTIMVPGSVLLVPKFLIMRDLGWLDTYWALIVPGMVSAFGVFLSRQFMTGVPDDYLQAARIDGCSDLKIYWHIILPLSKPLISTLGILAFLAHWNDFISPLIYLLDEDLYTLTLGLALLRGRYVHFENVQMAGAVLAVIPVLVLFFLLQGQIVRSLSSTGLKG